MASDEHQSPEKPVSEASPQRPPRREPPLIDAEPLSSRTEAADSEAAFSEPASSEARFDEPPPAEATAAAPPPSRESKARFVAPAIGAVALAVLGGLGWAAWRDANDATATLRDDVATFGSRLDALEKRPAPVGAEQVAALDRRVAALEHRPIAAPASSVDPAALAALDRRIAAVEVAPKAEALDDKSQVSPQVSSAPPVDLGPLEGRIAALEQRLQPLEQQLSTPKSEVRATESPTAAVSSRPNATTRAVVAQAIVRALYRGVPFPAEIVAAEAFGASPEELSPLKAVAEAGAPTTPNLTKSFEAARPAMLAAIAPVKSESGVLDRLTEAASTLVRVRPAGDVVGDDPPALVARIGATLERGTARQARVLWRRLPEAARTAGRAFGDDLERRAAADNAAGVMLDNAIGALGRPKGTP